MRAYKQLVAATIPARRAADLTGVSRATVHRQHHPKPRMVLLPVAPVNKLTEAESAMLLETLNDDRFVDLAPLQIYAHLLDEGTYLGSVSTMYRTLAANRQVKERRRIARHKPRARPELVATGPGQVYSWDITKLKGPVKGKYYDAYVMLDIYSRYIVGV